MDTETLYNNEYSDDEAYFNNKVVPKDLWGMQEGDFDYQTSPWDHEGARTAEARFYSGHTVRKN
jgi:hypothetical protein